MPDEQKEAEDLALAAYNREMETILQLPTDANSDVTNAHVISSQHALHIYFRTLLSHDEDEVIKNRDVLQELLLERLRHYQDENRRLSSEVCEEKLRELHQVIEENVKEGKYKGDCGREHYDDDINELKESYDETIGLGVMKEKALKEFFHQNSPSKHSIQFEESNESLPNDSPQKTKMDSLRDTMSELRSLFEQFQERPETWQQTRLDNITWLRNSADELEKHKKNVNVATVAGTSVGMFGTVGGIIVVSIALSPITFGGSLALGLGLGTAAVSVGGAVAAIGAQQVKKRVIDKDARAEAMRRLEEDINQWSELRGVVSRIQALGPDIETLCEQKSAAKNLEANINPLMAGGDDEPEMRRSSIQPPLIVLDQAAEAFKGASEEISLVTKAAVGPWTVVRAVAGVGDEVLEASRVAATAVRALGGIAIALGGVSLVVDTVTLVKTAKDMKEGSKCELAEKYRKDADVLEKNLETILEECRKVEKYVDDAKLALGWALKVEIVSDM